MSEDPFVQVHAPPAGQSLYAQVGHTGVHNTYTEFFGEDFIHAYLNPQQPGCGQEDHDHDCLCDVDVRKTEGMTWDKCPAALINVETHEDLVRAAANIWLNHDLKDRDTRVNQKLEWLDDPEVVARVTQMVTTDCSRRRIERTCHVTIDNHTFASMRRALGVKPQQRVNPDTLRRLHAEGLSIENIRKRIKADEGVGFHHTTISKALKRIGLQPNGVINKPRNGTPKGYRRSSGLSYREWRERYGEG